MRHPLKAIALLVTLTLAAPVSAGTSVLGRAEQAELVTGTAALLREEYVDVEVGRSAAADLLALAAAEGLSTPRTPEDFAAWLSAHLFRMTSDKHVRLRLVGAFTDVPDSNCGLRAADRLDDGIGYLRIDHFYRADECRAAFDAALARLADCRAVIVDLRENGGGGDANMLLASYFLAGNVLLNRIEWRRQEPLEFRAGPSTIPALAVVPLYILTSQKTFSAAEAVAYALQQCGRAVIVGEPSRGGANPNRFFPIGHGLEVSVSIGRTINAVSGTNWEGVGVAPDKAVPAAQALETARALLERP